MPIFEFINLPDNIATSTLAITGGLMSDLSPIWLLILGVLLFGTILYFLISSFRHH